MTVCKINETQNYVETIRFQKLSALPDQFEVLIQSQLLDAKDPDALHVKYRSIVSESALRELSETLIKVLDS